MELKSMRSGRLSRMDTKDQVGVMAYAVAMLFLTGGIAAFYTHDLTTIATYTVGAVTFGAATYLAVGGVALIFATNQMDANDMFDVQTVEGIAGVLSLGLPVALAWNPTFLSNIVADPIGGFVVAAIGVTSATILATFPY